MIPILYVMAVLRRRAFGRRLVVFRVFCVFVVVGVVVPRVEVRAQVVVHEPLLLRVFFEAASAEIPERYHRFASAREAEKFSEDSLATLGTIERYRWILDVIGSRMRRHPATTISVVGTVSEPPQDGGTYELGPARARAIAGYLERVWGIDSGRIAEHVDVNPWGVWSMREPLQFEDYRAAVITSSDWELVRPFVLTSPSTQWTRGDTGHARAVVVPIVAYAFLRREPDPVGARVIREIIAPSIASDALVEITGRSDVVGLDDRNVALSRQRADSVASLIRLAQPPAPRAITTVRGLGEKEPLFPNTIPEGRYFNRSVVVRIVERSRQ